MTLVLASATLGRSNSVSSSAVEQSGRKLARSKGQEKAAWHRVIVSGDEGA